MQPVSHIQGSGLGLFTSPGPPFREPLSPRPSPFTVERVARFLFWALLLGFGVWLLWYFARLVVYLIIGIVLSYLMRPLVDRLLGFGLGRILSILLTFIVVFGSLGVLTVFIAPFVAGQVSELSRQFTPSTLREMTLVLEAQISRYFPVQEGAIIAGIERGLDSLFQEDQIATTVSAIVGLFTNLFYAVLVIPFVTFFFLKDGTRIRSHFLQMVPNRYFEITLAVIEKIEFNLGRYFRALLLQCSSVALLAFSLLTLAGLDYALAVGLLAGIANTIPYFGPLVGFLAGVLVGFSQTGDFSLLPGIMIAMGLTRLADDVFFQPVYFARAAQAHPLIILFVVLIGAQVAGIVGMLVAIPIATTIRVAVQQVLWSLRNYRILKAA